MGTFAGHIGQRHELVVLHASAGSPPVNTNVRVCVLCGGKGTAPGCAHAVRAQRYQAEQRSAQDYTFEALHRVYFYDAWRVQPVLDAPGSELVLPPQPDLLVHGCCWPQPSATPDVLSVSDRATEEEEHGVQAGQPLSSPAATDATMADEEASEAVSVHSSSSESPTMPSAVQPEEDDARVEDSDVAGGCSRSGMLPSGCLDAGASDCRSFFGLSSSLRPRSSFDWGLRCGAVTLGVHALRGQCTAYLIFCCQHFVLCWSCFGGGPMIAEAITLICRGGGSTTGRPRQSECSKAGGSCSQEPRDTA